MARKFVENDNESMIQDASESAIKTLEEHGLSFTKEERDQFLEDLDTIIRVRLKRLKKSFWNR